MQFFNYDWMGFVSSRLYKDEQVSTPGLELYVHKAHVFRLLPYLKLVHNTTSVLSNLHMALDPEFCQIYTM